MKSKFINSTKRHEAGRYIAYILCALTPAVGMEVDELGFVNLQDVLKSMSE